MKNTPSAAGDAKGMLSTRWMAWLFLAVALLQIAPVWSARYFPTSDGPAHLYNAWVMRELVLRHDNIVTRTYAIDAKPYPNILDHVALGMLLGVFRPPVAEKVFVSAVILLFLGGAWMFAGAADPRASLYAFVAVPLAHHQLLKSGFYNFSISIGLYLVIVALWWRRRDRPDGQTIALIALLLLLCYFAHPMSTLLAIGSIGLLWLATLRGRPLWPHARHLLAFVPVLPLLAWFMAREHGRSYPSPWTVWNHLTFLAQTQNIVTYGAGQLKFGAALCALTVLLMVMTIAIERRRRDADAFLLILGAVLAAYMLAPGATAGGAMVLERIGLFIALLPLPWLTPRLPNSARGALAIAMTIVAAANTAYLARNDRRIARETTALVRAARAIPTGRTFYPVVFDRQPEGTFLALIWHTTAYAAIERRLVDLNNYEPRTGYFPVKYRDSARMFGVESIANNVTDFPTDRMASLAQYVFTWHMPDDAPVLSRLDRSYELLEISEVARIYRRRYLPSIADVDELLLPLAGTVADAGGPQGERWGVDQEIRNRGTRPLAVDLSSCAASVPCTFTLAPGEAKRIASDDPWRPYIVVRAAHGADVSVTTTAHRIDPNGTVSRFSVPSVPFCAFAEEQLDIEGVPVGERGTLRLWLRGAESATLVAGDVRRSLPADASGFISVRDLPPAPRLHIVADEPRARLWGFVTATSGRDAGALYLPQTSPCTLR